MQTSARPECARLSDLSAAAPSVRLSRGGWPAGEAAPHTREGLSPLTGPGAQQLTKPLWESPDMF